MKVINIDFDNKTFTTDDGTEYPFMFDEGLRKIST